MEQKEISQIGPAVLKEIGYKQTEILLHCSIDMHSNCNENACFVITSKGVLRHYFNIILYLHLKVSIKYDTKMLCNVGVMLTTYYD